MFQYKGLQLFIVIFFTSAAYGLLKQKATSRVFCLETYSTETFEIVLDIDKRAEQSTIKIEFSIAPNLLTILKDNLTYHLPSGSGCGEVHTLDLSPNLAVLDYLHAFESEDEQLIGKTTALVRKAYQNLMRCVNTDGSFGYSPYNESVYLTASIANMLQTASKYATEVDASKVERAFDWLASKQHNSGQFDDDMQERISNGVAMTSYVLAAMLENRKARMKHADVIQKGMHYLSGQLNNVNSAYDLSILTYVMMLNDHEQKYVALRKLMDKSTEANNGSERYWNSPNSVETTAYALLSIVTGGNIMDAQPLVRWLVIQHRNVDRDLNSQENFVLLKALTKVAESLSPSRNDYTVLLKYGSQRRTFLVNSTTRDKINYVNFPDNMIRRIELIVSGKGSGMLEVAYSYSIPDKAQ